LFIDHSYSLIIKQSEFENVVMKMKFLKKWYFGIKLFKTTECR